MVVFRGIIGVALEHAALDGRADGDDLIRIDALVGFLVEEFVGGLDHLGHAGHAADEDELVNLRLGELGIGEAGLHGLDGALEQRVGELLQPGAGEGLLDVLRPGGVGGDEGEVDVVGLGRGQGDLGLLGLLLEALEGVGLLAEVDAGVGLEFAQHPVDEGVVPVVAAEVGVAVGGLHLEHAVADLEHGDVERAAAEVIHGDLLVLLLVESVGERGGGGFVDDAQHLEPGDLAGVLGGLALGVIEIGGDGDDRLVDLFAELGFGVGLELGEDHRGDLGGAEALGFAVDVDLDGHVAVGGGDDLVGHALQFVLNLGELAAHETLDRENRVGRVGDGLAFGGLADQTLAILGEGHDGRGGARSL
jgi:hypothetical protein